jgi:hypothetical protein
VVSDELKESYVKEKADEGYTFIRYCIKPYALFGSGGVVKSSMLENLKRTVATCKKYGMGCLADMHKTASSNRIPEYWTDDYISFMGKLADELNSDVDLDYLIMETINEPSPSGGDDTAWYKHQNNIVTEMRLKNKDLTIAMVASQCFRDTTDSGGDSGINWDQMSNLVRMPKPPVSNVVITFHDYAPMTFTHQGAGWVAFFSEIKNIEYPPDAANVKKAIGRTDHPYAQSNLNDYLEKGWNRDVYDKRYAAGAQWRLENGNPFIICGEFGAMSITGGGRSQYYNDITYVMEKYNFGWAWWWRAHRTDMNMDKALEPYDPSKGNPVVIGAYSILDRVADNPNPHYVFENGKVTIINLAGKKVHFGPNSLRNSIYGANSTAAGIYFLFNARDAD